MSVAFRPDEFVQQLLSGEVEQVHGLVVPCGWSWCQDNPHALQQYEAFATKLKRIAPECFYVYKPSEIHCTIATLSSFKEKRSVLSTCTARVRKLIMRTWAQCIQRQVELSAASLQQPFELEAVAFELSDNAGFLLLKDRSGAVAVLRQCIRQAAQAQELRDLETQLGLPPLELSRLLHVPNIIHSTVLRYTATPADPSDVYRQCAQLALQWQPMKVQVSRWFLVYEHRPYMHVPKDSSSVIATYECGEGSSGVKCDVSPATETEKRLAARSRTIMWSCSLLPLLAIALFSVK